MTKKNKDARRAHRKQKEKEQKVSRRTPNLARVGDALTDAVLASPYAHPSAEKLEAYSQFTREQVILAGACYYYASAGALLLGARARDTGLPHQYSLSGGQIQVKAAGENGQSFDLVVGFVDDYDPQLVEDGNYHAWIQLHEGKTHHLIDFTARNWWILATVQGMTPAQYPPFVHIEHSIAEKTMSFTNLPYIYQVVPQISEQLRDRFINKDTHVDPATLDIALRAAHILDWDSARLSNLPVQKDRVLRDPTIAA